MKLSKNALLTSLLIFPQILSGLAHADSKKESIYTPLNTKECKEFRNEPEHENYIEYLCPGVAGYILTFGGVEGTGFITVGKNQRDLIDLSALDENPSRLMLYFPAKVVEWRVLISNGQAIAKALIFRVGLSDGEKTVQERLNVVRLDGIDSCIVATIPVRSKYNANEVARKFADTQADTAPCLNRGNE